MSVEPFNEDGSREGAGSLVLEIGLKPGEVPLRIPVAVQNFTAGLLTLKVTQSAQWVEWETVSGHDSLLRLPKTGSKDVGTIAGKVSWVKQSGAEGASIFLGIEITQPASQVEKLLEEQVLHTPKDIKGLWQQWDQVQVKTRRSAAAAVITLLIGLVLLAVGGGFLAAPERFPNMYGYVSLAAGGLLTLIAGIRFWRQRRV